MKKENKTQFDSLINKILKKNKDARLSKKSLQSLLSTGKVLTLEKMKNSLNRGSHCICLYNNYWLIFSFNNR